MKKDDSIRFVDDDGRLFVMIYEQAENKDEWVQNIFNAEGLFIRRKSLGLTGEMGQFLNTRWAVARNNRSYRPRHKEERGYSELIVYRMTWK